MTELDPSPTLNLAETACLEETRSAVLNVMVVEGTAIAISGWLLGRLDRGAWPGDRVLAWRLAFALLLAILLSSRVVLRVGSGRSALRNPSRRTARFFRAHIVSAMLGAIAVPIGIVYGWAVEPTLSGIAPFWVVALGVGFLALPKAVELEGFDEPIADLKSEPESETSV